MEKLKIEMWEAIGMPEPDIWDALCWFPLFIGILYLCKETIKENQD
jgi:hypothetical protein